MNSKSIHDVENLQVPATKPEFGVAMNDKRKENSSKTRLVAIAAAIALVLVGIGVGIGFAMSRGDNSGKASSNLTDPATPKPTPEPTPLPSPESNVGPVSFIGVGCFESEISLDTHLLATLGTVSRSKECSDRCFTRFFGVTENICSCFVDVPENRLAIGSCERVNSNVTDRMELYFNQASSTSCSQERTETVRNFLVEEDDAPFGFDIVENTFRTSPFELFKDECGTNIYEVQTEVSEGSQSLETTLSEVKSFADARRTERAASLETSASVSYKSFLYSASVQVSASSDVEQTNLFKSSGASENDAKLFTSIGVKRLAEVKIVDFDNTYRFVTLSRPFGNLLRDYVRGGFAKSKAYEIIEKYGQFVLTRGIFGGYMQLRTTVANSEISVSFSSEEDAKACYEASVSGEASGFGFKGKASVDNSVCTEEQKNKMRDSRERYGNEVSEQTVVGGRKPCATCDEFVVEAEDSTLLTTKDKYPFHDEGVQFRLLSDFLGRDKISPLEVKRLQITEAQFGDIQINLQQHILDFLADVGGIIGDCNCTAAALPYLDEDETGKQICKCYDPSMEASSTTVALKEGGTWSKQGNRRTCAWDRCPSSGFNWSVKEECSCSNGLNTCYFEGSPTTVVDFDEATLVPVVGEGIWKLESASDESVLMLGQGNDCATGSRCFEDPLRGGFRIDLTNSGYVFAIDSKVTVSGWSPRMKLVADGETVGIVEKHAAGSDGIDIKIPPGSKIVEVLCGGWCGSCKSELFVKQD